MTFSGKDPMAKPEAIRMSLAKKNVFLRMKGLLGRSKRSSNACRSGSNLIETVFLKSARPY